MQPERRTASRRLVNDGRILTKIDETRQLLELAKLAEKADPKGLDSDLPRLEQQLLDLAERAADEAVLFVVRALPAEEFDEIKRRHPPSEEQLERYKTQARVVPWVEMPEVNPSTCGPELLAACLVEPDWPAEEIADYWKGLSKGQQNQLWNLAYNVQLEDSTLPFYGAATGTTDGGGEPSTTPANRASPSQSS